MSEFNYLIALAMIEKSGKRFMPIGGKSVNKPIDFNDDKDKIKLLALEILLRVIQGTDSIPAKRFAGEQSILVAQIPLDSIQTDLATIKSKWIKYGDNQKFLSELKGLSSNLFSISFVKYSGVQLIQL